MRLVAAGLLPLLVYAVGEGAAPMCRYYGKCRNASNRRVGRAGSLRTIVNRPLPALASSRGGRLTIGRRLPACPTALTSNSPRVAVADPHAVRGLGALGFIHLISLPGPGGIVVPP